MAARTVEAESKTPPKTSAVPLNHREVRFANFYLEHGNATQAARDAGY